MEKYVNALKGIKDYLQDRIELEKDILFDREQAKIDVEALDIAIKKLKQESCEELDFVQPHKKVPINLEVCKMREATQKEHEGVEQYIDSIAKPCEDAQSKEDIAKAFQFGLALGFGKRYDEMNKVMEEIKKVITPPQKTGHWIKHEIKDTCTWLTCSVCGYEWINKKENFCPNCGFRMIELQNSER